ncbi:N-acetylneuraminate synthase family protein [Fulvivirga sediminis]|uniref:N-acetylneuraminate synthase family protein n=1 Tax=Fulvivirga sediminis TaxID=2803949 RepID=A0A937F6X8_9BACT|nr:N-acetylneuraminate synthase family protein [Fulvivirga sediminis]MBL3655384.1 N-acetylneuraminate synthase family protein [Fulvivirga sediminis]
MSHTYLIAEIGQNHNGSVDLAKLLIDKAAQKVVDPLFNKELKHWDAVKFTKRDLNEELSASAMAKPYDSPHSFGETYGEHREKLELSDEQHFELYKYAKANNLDFVETLCAIGCLSMLKLFTPDRLKVASRDLTNLPLLNAMAETKIPMIISTGMGGVKEIDDALEVITKHHDKVSILHCLSQYPSEYENINLNSIHFLKKRYSDFLIGYSDHSIGISIPTASVAMGAEMIEKHVTLDRSMKGTDQAGSLAPDGMYRMVRDIRNLELAFGVESKETSSAVESAKIKLERSIATNKYIPKGHKITLDDIHLLSPGDGFKWAEQENVIGKTTLKEISQDEVIYKDMIG